MLCRRLTFFKLSLMTRSARWVAALLALILAQFGFLVLYLGHEQTVSFWDYAMYANMAIRLFSFPQGTEALSFFAQSFSQNYNLLFALPDMVTFKLFEPTRTVFILTNFAIYFIAYEIGLAFVLRQIFHKPWKQTLLYAFLLCVAVPFAWYPLFEGYPDYGATALVTFAIGLALAEKNSRRTSVEIGLLLGLAILFRRHYAYPALALIVTKGLFDFYHGIYHRTLTSPAWIGNKLAGYIGLGLALLAVLVLGEPHYLHEILTTNYLTLYKSYERPPYYFIYFAFSHIGLGLLALTLAGYGVTAYIFPKTRRSLVFVPLFMLVWLFVWAFGPGQAGDHYLIALLPVFCVIGLYGLFAVLVLQKKLWPLIGAITLMLGVNSLNAVWLAPFELPSDTPSFGLFGSPRPPWVRKDLGALRALATYLKETTSDRDKIVVVGSSFVFNQDLMRGLFVDVLNDIPTALRFLQAPETDGEQDPPLDVYANGNVFLVTAPVQYHLPVEGQRVISALASRFPPDFETRNGFKKDEKRFTLADGVVVEIWRRTKGWTPSVLYKNLAEIRKYKDMPRQWIAYQSGGLVSFVKDPGDRQDVVVVQHDAGEYQTILFYDTPLTEGHYRVSATESFTPSCNDVNLVGLTLSEEGQKLGEESIPVVQDNGFIYLPFTIKARAKKPRYFSLIIKTSARTSLCTVALKQLRLEQTDIQGLP